MASNESSAAHIPGEWRCHCPGEHGRIRPEARGCPRCGCPRPATPSQIESLRGTLRIAQLNSNDDTNPTWDDFDAALATLESVVVENRRLRRAIGHVTGCEGKAIDVLLMEYEAVEGE